MNIHSNRADARPLWRRFALDQPEEMDAEVGPETVEALGELEAEASAGGSGAATGREGAWARLAFALDIRRHARALDRRGEIDK
jgi:hypothetical protein